MIEKMDREGLEGSEVREKGMLIIMHRLTSFIYSFRFVLFCFVLFSDFSRHKSLFLKQMENYNNNNRVLDKYYQSTLPRCNGTQVTQDWVWFFLINQSERFFFFFLAFFFE